MLAERMSRRRLIKATGAGVLAIAGPLAGAGCSSAPEGATQEVRTPTFGYGKGNRMGGRVLVAYATRTGSTVDVAAAIGETLGGLGLAVDVKPIKENPETSDYNAVVVGSAVNGGKWLPEAVEFVKRNQRHLASLPVALFCVHIMNLGEDEGARKNRKAYLNDVRPHVSAVDEAYFAGIGMDPAKASWIERLASRMLNVGPEGDNRDWKKIRGWATEIASALPRA